MRDQTLECAEIRSSFVAGRVPAGPAVEAHLAGCLPCRELFENDARLGRRLALLALPEVEPGGLLAQVEQDVAREVGLRARLRAQPRRVRVAALTSVAVALFVFQLVHNRRGDFAHYSPLLFWCVALALGVALTLSVAVISRGPSAALGSRAREGSAAFLSLMLPVLLALLAPLGAASPESAAEWGNWSGCFTYGAALVVPLVALYWLFERRDTVPFSALLAAGGVAGLAANLLLHAHCGSAHLGHLLLGHATVGVVWAATLRLALGRAQPSR